LHTQVVVKKRRHDVAQALELKFRAMSTTAETFPTPHAQRRKPLTAEFWFSLFVIALLYFGLHFPTSRYISPKHGWGYALGIIGGSMMLLLLLYPLRKRVRWLNFLGKMTLLFQVHMILGVLGPVLVLFHANFKTGATNSNVALACMLIVSGSGLFGRYFYAKIHNGLYGTRASLSDLRAAADRIRGQATTVQFLPDLVNLLNQEEQRLMKLAALPGLNLISPIILGIARIAGKIRLRRYIKSAMTTAAKTSLTLAQHKHRFMSLANDYVSRRFAAASRVATFHAYERLFWLWHVLHMPLFFMLIIAGIVHVIAVHVY
jgi:hypothetical protein